MQIEAILEEFSNVDALLGKKPPPFMQSGQRRRYRNTHLLQLQRGFEISQCSARPEGAEELPEADLRIMEF